HNGMLELRGEKMSKSEGNIQGLAEALDEWGPETLIMLFLQAHYASPMEYSDATLEQARAACETLRNRLRSGAGEDAGVRDAGCGERQGVVAEVAPYPYAGAAEVLGGERPLVVALDEVTDPHNLGAVARVAECAGAGGLVMTRRRSAAVTAAVCRASAGAVEH